MKSMINGRHVQTVLIEEAGSKRGYVHAEEALSALGIRLETHHGKIFAKLADLVKVCKVVGAYHDPSDTYIVSAEMFPEPVMHMVGQSVHPARPIPDDVVPIRLTPFWASKRSATFYALCIQQFGVEDNPRYAQRDTSGDGEIDTHCDAFVGDVCGAMGFPLPFWVNSVGEIVEPGRGRETDANGLILWMRNKPELKRYTDADKALQYANGGFLTVAAWYNPGGIGHVAIVRPGQKDPMRGIPIAQAGARNFDDGYLFDGFGTASRHVEYFTLI